MNFTSKPPPRPRPIQLSALNCFGAGAALAVYLMWKGAQLYWLLPRFRVASRSLNPLAQNAQSLSGLTAFHR